MNKSFSLDLQDKAIDDINFCISFLALSKNPLIKRKGFFDDFYVSIDTQNISFNANTFYLDHEVSFKNAIGSIRECKQDETGIKVVVQFYKDIEESNNAFLKYKNGLSNSVSVGFGDCVIEEKEKIDGLPHYHIKSGEIVELSAVWKGADPNAVISAYKLSKDKELNKTIGDKMIKENNYNDDLAQIIELGKIANASEKALEAIEHKVSFKDFSLSLIKDKNINQSMVKKDVNREFNFSLANYALGIATGKEVGEVELKSGTNGLIISNDYLKRFEDSVSEVAPKTTKSSDDGSGGFIPEYYRGDRFIEQVFAESNLLSLCDVLSGLKGTLKIPRDTSNIKAYWVKEGDKTTTSNISADSINLAPHTIKAKVPITRQMLYNMSPLTLESFIITSMRRAIKLRLEEDLLYGDGSEETPITGIFNISGVQSIENYFAETNYKKTLEFGGKLSGANLSLSNTHFATNSKGMIHLQSTHYDDKNNDKYLLNERATYLAGYKYFMNNLIKDNNAIFGDFKNIIIGTWNNLQIQALKDDEGDLVFTGFYDIGMAVKRVNAFVIAKS